MDDAAYLAQFAMAFRCHTIVCAVLGKMDQAHLACGTGIIYARILLENHPEMGDEAAENLDTSLGLEQKLGNNCTGFVSSPFGEWPFASAGE